MAQFAQNVPRVPNPNFKQRRTLKGHLNKITSLAWSADSKSILSGAQDGKLILWETLTSNKQQVISLQNTWVMNCTISPTGRLAASGGLDNLCAVYNLKEAEAAMSRAAPGAKTPTAKVLDGHVGFVSGIKFVSGDAQIITASGDHTCALWDVERGAKVTNFTGHSAEVMAIALLRDVNSGTINSFVSASGDNTARLWDIRSGQCASMFSTGDTNTDLLAIDAFPDNHAFATGGEDGVCRLFDIRAEQQLMTYNGPESLETGKRSQVTGLTFTHSGRALAIGYETEAMKVWDTFHGTEITTIKAHDERVSTLAVSPDGYALATGSWDKAIKLWA